MDSVLLTESSEVIYEKYILYHGCNILTNKITL